MALNLFFPSASTQPIVTRAQFSPLVLADRLLTLAQQADRAGYHDSASRLLGLMYEVLEAGPDSPKAS